MPFPKWSVEPVFLSRKPLPPDKKSELCDFDRTANLTFANCLRQLASVAKTADRIFVEIACECRLLGERTGKLKEKITSCQSVVDTLNARAVKVPVSDLSETAKRLRTEKPFLCKYEQTTQLFLPSNRPPCVDSLYEKACTSPVAVMCTIDQYRTDGLSASDLFMVTPVLGGTRKKKRKLLDIETRKPANFSLVKTKQDRIQSGSASLPPLMSPSMGYTLKQNENLELERLPSPEEQAMLNSLEYPSTVVSIDTSGKSFNRMSLMRRSLLHADFVIKRKKNKKKSKRRHTICEGENKDIEKALLRNVTNTSCQTDDLLLDITSDSSPATLRPSFFSRRRSRSVQDNSRRKIVDDFDCLKNLDSKDSEEDKEKSPTKSNTATIKKSKSSSLRSRAYNFNPISSLSAAISIAAVKMRSRGGTSSHKQDDGRSSSGNWSASSSTRASVTDSDHQQTVDGISSPSRNSVGKDSVLSDATHQDPHNRSRDDILPIQSLTCSPVKQRKYPGPWDANHGRISNTPTPDLTSQCSSSTPLVRSPYTGRRGISDDGDSSVYSVDTDGYYTSMHTDSGLWTNVMPTLKAEDVLANFRQRQESQSSVSTIDNSSINSFLSKSATECSSNSDSLKKGSVEKLPTVAREEPNAKEAELQDVEDSDKSYSPHPPNGSASESDHEAMDRIRVKTAISANRYPSMCAVSPETSDEEGIELKKIPPSNVNVIVAEVHREDNVHDNFKDMKIPRDTDRKTDSPQVLRFGYSLPSPINMYRSETPVPSSFSSNISHPQPVGASTPRSGRDITTFSSDFNDINTSPARSHISEMKNANHPIKSFGNNEEIIITEQPASPLIKNKSLIPLKYAQRITVTPIARKDSTGTILRSPLLQYSAKETTAPKKDKPFIRSLSKSDGLPTYVSFKAPDSPVSSVTSITPGSSNKLVSSPTNSLSRPVARVTLDPTGKVVFASNSLERPGNSRLNKPTDVAPKSYATLPMCQTNNNVTKSVALSKNDSYGPLKDSENIARVDGCDPNFSSESITNSISPVQHSNQNTNFSSFKSNSNDFTFRPSRGGRFCRSYFPSHLISNNSARGGGYHPTSVRTSYTPPCSFVQDVNSSLPAPPSENSAEQNRSRSCSENPDDIKHHPLSNKNFTNNASSFSSVPNSPQVVANVQNRPLSITNSGIWPGRTYFTSINNGEPNKFPPEINTPYSSQSSTRPSYSSFGSLSPPDLIPSGESPPSTLDITSPAGSGRKFAISSPLNSNDTFTLPTKDNLKSLSANELFAIIHNSKKKHNIKTESEKSMSPMSSRSVSPALSQTSLSRLQPVEKGVLTRRCDLASTDKSKWCNSMPSPVSKRLTAQEKLATKPTSMRDFKMLLLQTRTGSPSNNSRPSAAELLKISPPKNSPTTKLPVSSSFKTPPSHFNSSMNYSPGHGASKRTMRTRSPYLSRYDSAYPPIIEDCSEEMESYEDNQCLTPSLDSFKTPTNHETVAVKATSTWV